jgi:ATP-dependent Clp protease ATP-binding subunit ClpA
MSLDGFGPAARAVVAAAEDEARRLGSGGRVGTEHLLLGVLAVDGCAAASVLRSVGVTAAAVRRKVGETSLGTGGSGAGRSARAERALGRAHRFAHDAAAGDARSEHLLLGVLDVEGTAGQVLRGLGVDVERLRGRLQAADPNEPDEPTASAADEPTPDASTTVAVVRCPDCGADLAATGVTVAEVPVRHGGTAHAFACAACGVLLGIRGISGLGGAAR